MLVFVFLSSVVVGACTSQATTQPFTRTPQPTKESTAEINTPASTLGTILPSSTYTSAVSEPTNTPTKNPQAMLTEQAKSLERTQIASFSPTCDEANPHPTAISPQGNWLAISCGSKSDQTLRVYSKTGKKWVVQFKDYVSKEFIQDGQTPMGALYPVHWTHDEMYLYFRSAIGFSGGGTCFYGGFGQGLYRLNLENGTVSATLAPLIGPDEYLISFSPDGRWLAYNAGVPTIFNLQAGKKIVLHEGKNAVGDFTWSPDSSNLLYGTCQTSEDYLTIQASSIRIFSLETREAKTVLETKTGFLRIESGEGNKPRIYDGYTNHPSYLYFDWSTQQVITPTVTPTP